MNEKEIWEKSLIVIEREISSSIGFSTYIAPTEIKSLYNGVLTLTVENELCRNMINIRYKSVIERCVSAVCGETVSLNIVIKGEEPEKPAEASPSPSVYRQDFINSLNPQYTFNNFVVGPVHQYAHAVALNAAKFPGQNYNPLFLYGHSGLGKTHLMQAIGNEILRANPSMRVLYVTSERFTNDLISSIREKNTEAFRQRYREVDALLVDDVQFIQGKENVQEEFFHTFNDLYDKHKQIVITSDRTPKELVVLEERLRNRFGWGVVTEIPMPDFETRVAILQKKALSQGAAIDDSILQYIAQRINTSIRELEGALSKLTAYAGISGQPIDIQLTDYVLKDLFPEDIKITSSKIIQKVSAYYKISESDILSAERTKEYAFPRQVAMYLCDMLTDLKPGMIGQDFGNKDRSTVIHNVKKIKKQLESDEKLQADIEFIKNDLKSV